MKKFISLKNFLIIALIILVVILIQIIVFSDTVFAEDPIRFLLQEFYKYDSQMVKTLNLAKTNGIIHHPEIQNYLKSEIIPTKKLAKIIIDECILRVVNNKNNYTDPNVLACFKEFKIYIEMMKKHSEFLDELYNKLYWKKYGR